MIDRDMKMRVSDILKNIKKVIYLEKKNKKKVIRVLWKLGGFFF